MAIFVSTDSDSSQFFTQQPSSNEPDLTGGVAEPQVGTPPGEPEQSTSMALPVTRHAQIAHGEFFQFLLCGIDTIDIGVYVRWKKDWNALLSFFEEKKQASQGTNGILYKTEIGREYLFLPSGKPPQYRFHLQFLEHHLFISKSEECNGTPNVYVSFLSCAIWHEGIDALLDLLDCDLDSFGAEIYRIVPSRVDVCADFKIYPPLTKHFLDIHRVSRSQVTDTIENDGNLESYYCGAKKAEVHVTLYYKGLEIGRSNKQWFLSLWNVSDPTDVFRVEFRLRRPFLHKYRINSLDDLRQQLGSIWGYLTTEWFSLRMPDNPETDRRTIHPLWAAIQQCGADKFGKDTGKRRAYSSDNIVPINKILPHILGRTITIAAMSGIKNRKESIHYLCELLECFSDDASFNEKYREKCIKLGYRGIMGGEDNECCPF